MNNKAHNQQTQFNFVIVPGKSRFNKLNQNFSQYNITDEIEMLPDALNIKLSNGNSKLALAFVY